MSEMAKVRIVADFSRFKRSMAAVARAAHRVGVALMDKRQRRRHMRRCWMCSPMVAPRPLRIDGHAYRRKTRSRRRRR